MAAATSEHPLFRLHEADLNMVVSFVLASGSIKELARVYGVSYPTMRGRLNGLIERLRIQVNSDGSDPLNDLLAELIASGQILPTAAHAIRDAHRRVVADRGQPPSEGASPHA